MGTSPIDYDALAKQSGAITTQNTPDSSAPVDYAALAKQAGAISSTAPPTSPTPIMDAVRSGAHTAGDFLGGFGAGIFSTVKGAADLTHISHLLPDSANSYLAELATPPPSTSGTIGKGAEQAAEYLIPGSGEEKLAQAGLKGLPLIAARTGIAAAGSGAVGAIQGGTPGAAVMPALTAGGTTAALGAIAPLIASTGRKIQASTIRPRLADMRDGFKWSTLDKFPLTGNLEQSMNQVDSQLTNLRKQRNALIAPGSANVNLEQTFQDALNEVNAEAKNLGYGHMGQSAINQVQNIKNDIAEIIDPVGAKAGTPNLNVDIEKAENLKEFLGTLGAWAYGRGDPDSKVSELVANTLYSKVKNSIEHGLGTQGPQVRALNKQMQELIPVKNAMIARLPVEERNRMFSLSDIAAMMPAVVTGHVGLLGLEGLTRAQKSLRFGNWLNRNAPGITGAIAGPATAGVAAQTPANPYR